MKLFKVGTALCFMINKNSSKQSIVVLFDQNFRSRGFDKNLFGMQLRPCIYHDEFSLVIDEARSCYSFRPSDAPRLHLGYITRLLQHFFFPKLKLKTNLLKCTAKQNSLNSR